MSREIVCCRLCLVMEVPMYVLTNSPLQEVYEKLTSVSLNTVHRPVAACYLCYSLLSKSHDLMVRAVRADKLLARIQESGDVVQEESILLIKNEAVQLNYRLIRTATHVITLTGTDDVFIKTELKEEPQERDEGEFETQFVEHLKLVDSGNENMEEDLQVNDDGIKMEERTEEVDVDTLVVEDREDIKVEELEELHVKSDSIAGTASTKKYKESLSEILDSTTLAPQDENIWKKPSRSDTDIEKKVQCGNIDSNVLQSTIADIDLKQTLNMPGCSYTVINKGNNCDDCASTNTDVNNDINEDLTKILYCTKCGDMFYNKDFLIEHMEKHNAIKRVNDQRSGDNESTKECPILHQKSFSTNHEERHIGKNSFECEICLRRFTRKSTRDVHLKTHTKEQTFECKMCQRRFSRPSSMLRHLKTHTGEKPFECDICQRRFTQKTSLDVHIKRHSGDKPFACQICQRKFVDSNSLSRHSRIHTGERPFECEICQRRFTNKSNRDVHLKTHTEEPFECEICQRRFTYKRSRVLHLKTHTEKQPFECEICQRRFNHPSRLSRHLLTHTGEKPFECNICQRRFTQKSNRDTHLKTHQRTTL